MPKLTEIMRGMKDNRLDAEGREVEVVWPQQMFNNIGKEIGDLAEFFGVKVSEFVEDADVSRKNKCVAVKSNQFQVNEAQDAAFGWNERAVKLRCQVGDDGFKGSVQNIEDSMTQTTFQAARWWMQKLDPKNEQEAESGLKNIENAFIDALKQLDHVARRAKGKKANDMSVFDKKIKITFPPLFPNPVNYIGILQTTKILIAQHLQKVETKAGIKPEWQQEWISALENKEKDLLSSTKRNPQVAVFVDDPSRGINAGYVAEIGWPLSDISSLDRREYNPKSEQVRPNFWMQTNIHYDKDGAELSRSVIYRAASASVFEIEDKEKRLDATKEVIRNELRLYAFLHIRQQLMNNPNLSLNEIRDLLNKGVHSTNLGLQSTHMQDYNRIAEVRDMVNVVLDEIKNNNNPLDLGKELAGELARIANRQELASLNTEIINPHITLDNLGTNSVRGADTPYKIPRKVSGIEPLQVNIRKQANLDRCAAFIEKIKKRSWVE